jgi:hypothetical protein
MSPPARSRTLLIRSADGLGGLFAVVDRAEAASVAFDGSRGSNG